MTARQKLHKETKDNNAIHRARPLLNQIVGVGQNLEPSSQNFLEPKSGQPLEPGLRAELEPRFGHNFANVQVHADHEAHHLSNAIDARAFSIGEDLFFGYGQYNPDTVSGLHLLAHELTHVVQQDRFSMDGNSESSRAEQNEIKLSGSSDSSEVEARANADAIMSGEAVAIQATPSAAISRAEEHEPTLIDSPLFKGAMTAAGFIPGIGGVAKIMNAGFGGARSAQNAQEGNGVGAVRNGMGGLGSFMGGIAALDGFSTLAALGAPASSALTGLAATGEGVVGAAGGASLGSAGAALGPAAAVLAAGAGGMAAGDFLYNHTSVGEHANDSVAGVDHFLTDTLLGEGSRSLTLQLDEMRQEEWDKTSLNPLTWGHGALAAGALIDEAAIGTAGAIGGLVGGAVDGLGAIGGGIADGASYLADGAVGLASRLNPFDWDW